MARNEKSLSVTELVSRKSEGTINFPGSNGSSDNRNLHEVHQTQGYELRFKGLCKTVDKKEILSDVNGSALPGELLAIMGPSGAGKSTLLNALAGRLEVDSGQITLNSRTLNKQMRRKISYVLQADTFLSNLTFWETIWFTALLRLPGSMPEEEKKKRVYEIIDNLDMRKCMNTIIGDQLRRGLSGGEKKRANIACELLNNPALMLLDEPTSGLDSSTSFQLISTLKSFAVKSGKTIVLTIHQPSSQIYNMFDKLLLLCGGKTVYFGDAHKISEHLSSVGFDCPPNYNISDYMLDVVKEADEKTKNKLHEKAKQLRLELDYPSGLKHADLNKSSESTFIMSDRSHKTIKEDGVENTAFNSLDVEQGIMELSRNEPIEYDDRDAEYSKYKHEYVAKWPTSFWLQFSVLSKRGIKQAAPRVFSRMNVVQTLLLSVVIGILYFRTQPQEDYLLDRTGIIFFPLAHVSFLGALTTITSIPAERPVINKERLAGYYRLSAYVLAKGFSELPLVLALPVVFCSIVYWLSGINYNFLVYLQILGIELLTTTFTASMGLFYGCLIMDFSLLFVFLTTTMLVSMIAGGFYVTNVPAWADWMNWISYIRYVYLAVIHVDILTTDIKCSPVGSTYCFNMTIPENITDPGDSRLPTIPQQLRLEDETLYSYGFGIWTYALIIMSLTVAFYIGAYIVLRFIRKPKTV